MKKTCEYAEMMNRFPGEWILVGEPNTDESFRVISGEILYHSKDRDELYHKAIEMAPAQSAIIYLGEIAKDMAVVL